MKNSLLCMLGALVAVSAATVAVVVAKNACENKRKKIKFTECDCNDIEDDFFDEEEEFIDYTCQCEECCDDCCEDEDCNNVDENAEQKKSDENDEKSNK